MIKIDVDWDVMKPVIAKLLEEDWMVKFENDSDACELENIAEDSAMPETMIRNVVEYFKMSGQDPIAKTRVLLTPDDDAVRVPIIIFYGSELETNGVPDKYVERVIELIREVEKNNREEIAKFMADELERNPMFKDVMDRLGKL
jgi:hypothetical protein